MSHEFVFTDVAFQRQRARRIRRLLRVNAWILFAGCAAWLVIAAALRIWPVFWFELAGIAASLVLLGLLRRGATPATRHLSLLVTCVILVGIAVEEANSPGSQPVLHLYMLCVAMASFLLFFDSGPAVPWTYAAACFAFYAARHFEWLTFAPMIPADADLQAATRQVTRIAVFAILVALANLFVGDIAEAERQLALANTRLEVIVDSMLPESIANRLREEGHTFADAVVGVTVLFADVVGFSRIAAEQPAEATVALLDRLFSRFDDLVEQAGVEKIKTDRDVYMVAGGVPLPLRDHARAVAELALAMREEAHRFGLDLRIGINSGPVVAGVIGQKRFVYDLWGDTVNVASRMQSTGVPNGIQVTDATRSLLAGDYQFEARGPVEVKGRGRMDTYLLVGRAEQGEA
jgi:class 3 adenylate cyclase